jgi:uncharacterized repeat protein (TIGR01451 family)
VSKGRRLITALGILLAVGFGVRAGLARPQDPPPALEEPAKPLDMPPPPVLEGLDEPANKPSAKDAAAAAEPAKKKPAAATKKKPGSSKKASEKPAAKAASALGEGIPLLLPTPSQAAAQENPEAPASSRLLQPAPANEDAGNERTRPMPAEIPKDEQNPAAEGNAAPLPTPAPPHELEGEQYAHPTPARDQPLRDENILLLQAGAETNPLPGAQDRPGQSATPGAAVDPNGGDGFVLPVDKMPVGPQSVGLTIQVQSPPSMNLNRPAKITIAVKNNGPTDALGVVVRDRLPDGLKFLESQPEAQPAGDVVAWHLGTVTAGSERKITMNVKPVQVGTYDHGATVSMKTGARAKTTVMEPKLKVEQTVNKSKLLKGQQVRFDITVTNTGSGPARDVVVQAKLTPGLRHEEGNVVALSFAEVLGRESLKPNESVTLSPLIVDTAAGGVQSCDVEVSSPDVAPGAPEAHSQATVEVTEPMLKLTLKGSPTRFTDTIAEYTIVVENPGSAPAQNVRVSARLEGSGRPVKAQGAEWDSAGKRLKWTIATLEPKSQPVQLKFQVKVGGVQIFQVHAEAVSKTLSERATCSTHVLGSSDVRLAVTEPLRILDVGQETVCQIRLENKGTKDATRIQLRASLSHLKASMTFGTDQAAKFDEANNVVLFPLIERLVPGSEMVLEIKVTATDPGLASCKVFLTHDDLQGEKIEAVVPIKITGPPPG